MKEPKRGGKTESLSLRIDPKTKFVLEFMVRVKGFRITDLIEQAIKDYAEKTTVGGGDGYEDSGKNWLHYWHPEEGVRTINLIFDRDIQTTFEEDEIADFIEQHMEFFFIGPENKRKPSSIFIQILWPKIHQYVEHWRDNKASNRWATGNLMVEAIKSAGMQGPKWPRPNTPSSLPGRGDDLDDEIPF